jgi:GT2 family glycosyltransferase
VRGEPTVWRLATEYLFIRKLAPRSKRLNPLYAGGFAHDEVVEADWLFGPALLVRREAADTVGLFDEAFFMFSEEVDWMTRFRRAGWKVLFYPGAEVVHVGGASHGGNLYVENLRGHLRWFDKHRGAREAERVRRLLLLSLRLRAALLRREEYREGVRFLRSGSARTLLKK